MFPFDVDAGTVTGILIAAAVLGIFASAFLGIPYLLIGAIARRVVRRPANEYDLANVVFALLASLIVPWIFVHEKYGAWFPVLVISFGVAGLIAAKWRDVFVGLVFLALGGTTTVVTPLLLQGMAHQDFASLLAGPLVWYVSFAISNMLAALRYTKRSDCKQDMRNDTTKAPRAPAPPP